MIKKIEKNEYIAYCDKCGKEMARGETDSDLSMELINRYRNFAFWEDPMNDKSNCVTIHAKCAYEIIRKYLDKKD